MAELHEDDVARLIDGELPWPAVRELMKNPKDLKGGSGDAPPAKKPAKKATK